MLAGLRVLDLTDERGHLAGRILGDLGADVVKVEPPHGDGLRQHSRFAWEAANASKRGIVLDLARSADDRGRLRDLAAHADVLLDTALPAVAAARGHDADALTVDNPRLVYAAITPFGRTGPRAAERAHDLAIVAAGGNLALTGDPDRPPVRCSLPTSSFHAAPEAALGVLIALATRERTGRGDVVDISMQECQLATLISAPGQYARTRRARQRAGARVGPTREIWAAADGWVSFGLRGGVARAANLRALVDWMDEHGAAPSWLRSVDWTRFHPLELPVEELARLEDAFARFFRTRTMRELYEAAIARRILLAPCNDGRAVLTHPQLRARELFAPVVLHDGRTIELPTRFAATADGAIRLRRPAPGLGEHQAEVLREWARPVPVRAASRDERRAAALPPAPEAGAVAPDPAASGTAPRGVWADLRILELGSGAAGPVATRYFAEHGATVVRVESRTRPDFLRTMHLTAADRDDPAALDRGLLFALLNADKRSVAIDAKHPEGAALLRALVGWADVVSENFTPGVMASLGLAPDALLRAHPRLVVVGNSLFGQTGPHRHYPGFGGQGAAIAGFNHLTGWPDREAHGPYATITDSLAPRFVAVGIAAALRERDRTGLGRHLDVAQIETGVWCLGEMVARASAGEEDRGRRGNRCGYAAPHGVYPCAGEDRWIALAVLADDEWVAFAATPFAPAWARDARFATTAGRLAHEDELDARIADWTRPQEAALLAERLQAVGVEAVPVATLADLLDDPQLAHRGHWVDLEHAALGRLRYERSAIRLAGSPSSVRRAAPRLGADTHAVLAEALGLAPAEIARLEAAGALT